MDAYLDKAYVLMARDGDLGAAKQVLREVSLPANRVPAARLDQGLIVSHMIRFFREVYCGGIRRLRSGIPQKVRQVHPAMIASIHLSRAIALRDQGGQPSAIARYDSARVHFERIIQSNPQSAFVSVLPWRSGTCPCRAGPLRGGHPPGHESGSSGPDSPGCECGR